jgi:hypothetical protein
MSRVQFSVDLDLPDGWEFEGIWIDPHTKEPETRWSTDVVYRNPETHKSMISIETQGATLEEALAKVEDEIRRVVGELVTTWERL